ncbi:MAG TPA: hypothetical protein VLH58_00800, partial [Candidatus Methylomirabilis sp.]|nr:hypothetical protein [Candidatus Methylomirabilis sp.]
ALAVVTGGASVHDFTDSRLQDARIQEGMRKVEVRGDPDLLSRARIEVHRADGEICSVEPSIRSLTSEEVREKFADVVRPVLSARRTERILDDVGRLERLKDVRDLTRQLRRRIPCRD